MADYLVFVLYGPLSAWGDAASIEVRSSARRPGKSAIVGLLSCALGWRREEQQKMERLNASYEMATKTVTPGTPLLDYHTAQQGPKQKNKRYHSRRDELTSGKTETKISQREYHCDAVHVIALRAKADTKADAQPSIHEICEHLRLPRGILYLGRRSCPPALPLDPKVVAAGGFGEALDSVANEQIVKALGLEGHSSWRLFGPQTAQTAQYVYAWEGDAGDLEAQQIVVRRDNPMSRTQHLFQPRTEKVAIRCATISEEG